MRRLSAYLTALFLVPAAAFAQSDDRGFLQGLIEDNLSGAGREVRIEGFEGALSSEAKIGLLTIADDDGIWLTLREVTLNWNRGALLRGRLEVNTLSAASIDLPRLPAPTEDPALPAPEASGFRLPELPVAVLIGDISSPSISIGAPVMGVAAEFSIDGALTLADGAGEAKLEVVRSDGQTGTIDLDAAYSNADTVLTLALRMDEAPGGIFATLAGLPGAPAVNLDVSGSGPMTDFSATLALATDGAPRLSGDLRLGSETPPEDGSLPFRAALGGDVAPLFAPDYREFFGPDIRLNVSGARAADGALAFDVFTLKADAIELDGNLSLTAAGLPDAFDLSGQIASADGQSVLLPLPGARTEVGRVDLRVGFDASTGDAWTGTFGIDALDRPGFSAERMDLTGSGQIALPGSQSPAGSFTANLDFAARALDLGDPAAGAALGETVTGRIEVVGAPATPLRIAKFDIAGETYGLSSSGTLDLGDRDLLVEGRATVAARDLSVFSGLAARPLAGAVEVTASGSGALLGGTFAIDVDGRTKDVAVGIAEADAILSGQGSMSLGMVRDLTGIDVRTLRVGTPVARITASGKLQSEGSSANVSASIDDAALVLKGLDGRHALSLIANEAAKVWDLRGSLTGDTLDGALVGSLDLSSDAPAFNGTASVDARDLAPLGPPAGLPDLAGSVSAKLSGNVQADLSVFDLKLEGSGQGIATGLSAIDPLLAGMLSVDLDATRSASDVTIRALRARAGTFAAEATGTVAGLPANLVQDIGAALGGDGPAPRFVGTVSVSSSDLSPVATLSGLDALAGALRLSLDGQITADLSSFDVEVKASGSNLVTGLAKYDPLLAGPMSVDLSAQRSEGPVELRRLNAATATIAADVTGTLSGLPEKLLPDPAAAFGGDGPAPVFEGKVALRASDLSPAGPAAGLDRLGGALTASASGRIATDLSTLDLTLDANAANLATGIAAADEYLRGGAVLGVKVARDGDQLTIDTAKFASPALNATAKGSIGPNSGDIAANVTLDNLGRIIDGFSGKASANVKARHANGAPWQVDATADGPGGTNIAANGTVATDASGVNLKVTGSAPLGFANTFIAPRSIGGTARFDLRVSGPPALSSVSGSVTTSDGRFVAPNLGIVIERMDGGVTLASGTANLGLDARVQGGGRINLSGPITLSQPFGARLVADLRNVKLSDPDLYETRVTGKVTVDGALTGGATVAGRLALGRTELRIPASISGGTAPIPDITHRAEPRPVHVTRERAGILAEAAAENGGGRRSAPFPLDIRIDAPNQIFLRGRGLDAELGGQLRIQGTSDDVVPVGQFNLIRGRLDILGKRLDLEEGSVTLQGEFDPFVRLVATSRADDVTVRIVVEGAASDPQIRFESQPDLPEDEVLARLLFGRGIENISAFQAAQLAAAVATLSGRGGDGIVGKLRSNFGLDDFDVATDEEGGTAVRAGKYLSDNIYTNIVIGSEGTTELQLNLDLTPSVTVTGRTTNDGDTGVGVYYERDY